jgi:hypothetical protein
MHPRLPLILSASALALAFLASTGLGQAAVRRAEKAVPLALFAKNAGKLNGHTSSNTPAPGQIPVVRDNGKLDPAIAGGFDATKMHVVQTAVVEVPANNHSPFADVSCPAGEQLLSGGFSSSNPFLVIVDAPQSATTWRVELRNTASTSAFFQARALCYGA